MKSSHEHKKSNNPEQKPKISHSSASSKTAKKQQPKGSNIRSNRPETKVRSRLAPKPGDKGTPKVDVKIRPAVESDAEFVSKLLFASFSRFAQYGIGMGKEERAKGILMKAFQKPHHRYSFEYILIAEHLGKKVGLAVSLPGKLLGGLNRRFGGRLLGFYSLKGKILLITRLLPFVFMKEGDRDEFVISNLFILQKFQERGFGETLVKFIEKQARRQGYRKMATLIEVQNTQTRKFFEGLGFKVKAVVLEPNRRIKQLGAGYQRMMKNL